MPPLNEIQLSFETLLAMDNNSDINHDVNISCETPCIFCIRVEAYFYITRNVDV